MLLTHDDWYKFPWWVRFHAVDGETRKGWLYENAPIKDEKLKYWRHNGRSAYNGLFSLDSIAWEDTVQERPLDTYPCLFCGYVELCVEHDQYFQVVCLCGCRGPYAQTEAEAWEKWVKRVLLFD